MQTFYLVQVIPGIRQNVNGSHYVVVKAPGKGGAGVLYAPTRDREEAQQWADSLDTAITVSHVGGFFQLEDSNLAAQYVQLGMASYSAKLPEWENEAEVQTVEVTEVTEAGKQQPA